MVIIFFVVGWIFGLLTGRYLFSHWKQRVVSHNRIKIKPGEIEVSRVPSSYTNELLDSLEQTLEANRKKMDHFDDTPHQLMWYYSLTHFPNICERARHANALEDLILKLVGKGGNHVKTGDTARDSTG